eukprot:Gregarina_sp_Poly_1__5213@NODE_2763_length_1748_cov_3_377751_g1742_i0_p2_GENE_NODE_2763_length_1748_cov_3_377751_g1742_i0NODE_2763_length_1748_cov_3_377751_g1742_i0_p2_ORF_typecomplete_len205_score16_30DUF2378/PF09536_10/0_26_NODE_2763_length_1748_cov_3_377751_g1742_i07821396
MRSLCRLNRNKTESSLSSRWGPRVIPGGCRNVSSTRVSSAADSLMNSIRPSRTLSSFRRCAPFSISAGERNLRRRSKPSAILARRRLTILPVAFRASRDRSFGGSQPSDEELSLEGSKTTPGESPNFDLCILLRRSSNAFFIFSANDNRHTIVTFPCSAKAGTSTSYNEFSRRISKNSGPKLNRPLHHARDSCTAFPNSLYSIR